MGSYRRAHCTVDFSTGNDRDAHFVSITIPQRDVEVIWYFLGRISIKGIEGLIPRVLLHTVEDRYNLSSTELEGGLIRAGTQIHHGDRRQDTDDRKDDEHLDNRESPFGDP